MSDTPAKRQAYSFAFPPDKKQAFTKIADEKYQRPASWLLLAAIDQVIANGGLLAEEPSPALTAPSVQVVKGIDDVLAEYVQKDNWDDLVADVADLREQLTQLATSRVLTMEDVTAQCSSRVEIQAVIDRAVEKLRLELADVKQDCDFTTEGIIRLIDDAISKASIPTVSEAIATTTAKKAPAAPGDVNPEVLKIARRLEADNGLQHSVRTGMAKGLTGKALCDFLFENGHGANNGTKPFDASVGGRFIKAIEHLNSSQNGDEPNEK